MKNRKLVLTFVFLVNSYFLLSQDIICENNVINSIIDDYIEVLRSYNSDSRVIKIEFSTIGEIEYFDLSDIYCQRELSQNPSYILNYKGYSILFYLGFEKYLRNSNLTESDSLFFESVWDGLIKDTIIENGGGYLNIYHNVIIDDLYSYRYKVIEGAIVEISKIESKNH